MLTAATQSNTSGSAASHAHGHAAEGTATQSGHLGQSRETGPGGKRRLEAQPERQSGRLQRGAGPQADQSSLRYVLPASEERFAGRSLGNLFRHSSSKLTRPELVNLNDMLAVYAPNYLERRWIAIGAAEC